MPLFFRERFPVKKKTHEVGASEKSQLDKTKNN